MCRARQNVVWLPDTQHNRLKREKIQIKKELMSLGVAMRTRSPLLAVRPDKQG